MATAATITERRKDSWGARKCETGKVTLSAGTDYTITTKLRSIDWFEITSIGTVTDSDIYCFWNYSDGGATVAPGVVFLESSTSSSISNGSYRYWARGK